jgi:hypothetical protein
VSVSWNGTTLGELNFVGQDQGKISLDVPRELVQEGANTVTLTAEAGDNDISLVDTISLEYPHTYTAESDTLRFTADAGEHVTINGFTHAPKRLIDITNPADPIELTPDVHAKDGQFELEVSVPSSGSGVHSLLAVAEEQIAHPFDTVANHPSRWHRAQSGDEVLMISSEQFASQLAPLVELRRSQRKSAAVVLIDDLYDEFNFGERSPDAIRDVLKTATERWQHKPKYVLLVGDASVDPRNYLGFGSFDFVPTKIIATSELKTASDDWFSDFGNSGLGRIPTGRLPVRTAEQAKNVVGKLLAYERADDQRSDDHGDWINEALLVADRDDTVNFTRDTKSVAALFPKAMKVTAVLASTLDASAARKQVVAGINSGKLLVNYIGHGSVEIWSGENLLDDTSASTLSNGTRLPVFLIMDCLNGFFHDVYTESLAESLLLSKDGGAVAVWASSGLTEPEPQAEMDQNLVRLLFAGPSVTLGDAIRNAKSKITDPDARRTYILFGDPMLRLRRPHGATGR